MKQDSTLNLFQIYYGSLYYKDHLILRICMILYLFILLYLLYYLVNMVEFRHTTYLRPSKSLFPLHLY